MGRAYATSSYLIPQGGNTARVDGRSGVIYVTCPFFMNKVIVITGASSGIGKSIGNYLTEKRYTVYGTSRNPKKYPKSKFTLIKSDVKRISQIDDLINHV